MFLLDCEARPWVFLSLPSLPTPARSALLRVRAYLLFQAPLLGLTEKRPGKTVDLSFQDDKLLFLFNLQVTIANKVHKITSHYPRSSIQL